MSTVKAQMIRLKEDLVIPAGTEFECIDGTSRKFHEGNYEHVIAISDDATAKLVVGWEPEDPESAAMFEEV